MLKKRVDVLDLIRIGLFLTIFLCHTSSLLSPFLKEFFSALTGYSLELFFIISGFLSTLNYYDKNHIKTIPFVIKKLKSIYPLHLIGYGLCLFLQYQQNALPDLATTVKTTLSNWLLLQSWTPNETYVYSYNGVTWFLSSLAFCFFLTPLALKVIKKFEQYSGWMLIGTVVFRFLYVTYFNTYVGIGTFCYTNVFPPYRFLEYLLGMQLGLLFLQNANNVRHSSMSQFAGFIMFFLAFNIERVSESRYGSLFILLELFLLISLVFFDGIFTSISKIKLIKHFSSIGMPFFILHQIVIKYTNHYLSPHLSQFKYNKTITWFLIFIITIAACELYQLANKLFHSKKVITGRH